MARSIFVYVTYIRTTPDKLWQALTDAEFTTQYWFGMCSESSWKPGAAWNLRAKDGAVWDSGGVVEADPPRRLVIRWQHQMKPELKAEGDTLCAMDLEPVEDGTVKLTVTHTCERDHAKVIEAVSGGWPKVLSNLKSLLETGAAAMREPYPGEKAKA